MQIDCGEKSLKNHNLTNPFLTAYMARPTRFLTLNFLKKDYLYPSIVFTLSDILSAIC